MEWQQFIAAIYARISQELERVLDGLTKDDLNQIPGPDCNSIGWLVWHLTRSQDRAIADLTGEDQFWVKDGWHARFGRPPDPADTGFGHSSEDIAAFKSPGSKTLWEYHLTVFEPAKRYIVDRLSETDLEREVERPTFSTVSPVHAILVGVLNDSLQHLGQAAYLRGMLKGKGWLGR
jgi:hypothetical protein